MIKDKFMARVRDSLNLEALKDCACICLRAGLLLLCLLANRLHYGQLHF